MSASKPAGAQMVLAGADSGKAGPLGLLVVVALGIACYFLFKSMSGHLRKVQNGLDVAAAARSAAPPAASLAAPKGAGDGPQLTADIDTPVTGTSATTAKPTSSDAQSVPKRTN